MIPVGPSQDALLRLAFRVACATPPGGGGLVWCGYGVLCCILGAHVS